MAFPNENIFLKSPMFLSKTFIFLHSWRIFLSSKDRIGVTKNLFLAESGRIKYWTELLFCTSTAPALPPPPTHTHMHVGLWNPFPKFTQFFLQENIITGLITDIHSEEIDLGQQELFLPPFQILFPAHRYHNYRTELSWRNHHKTGKIKGRSKKWSGYFAFPFS